MSSRDPSRRDLLRTAGIAAAGLAGGAVTASRAPAVKPNRPTPQKARLAATLVHDPLIPLAGAWFGAYPSGGNGAPGPFEAPNMAGRVLNLLRRYEKWDSGFPGTTDQGYEPPRYLLARWTYIRKDGTKVQLADIPSGAEDAVINAAAARWAAFGKPVFIDLFGEFDRKPSQDQWCSSIVTQYGYDSPQASTAFVNAWCYIYGKIAPVAPNVIWVWCPTGNRLLSFTQDCYPGDAYTDWVTADLYDPSLSKGSPAATYTNWNNWVQGFSGAPRGLTETGIDNNQPDAAIAAWISQVPACLAALGLKMWMWYSSGGALGDTSIVPGSQAAAALAAAGAGDYLNQEGAAYKVGSLSVQSGTTKVVVPVTTATQAGHTLLVSAASGTATLTGVADSQGNVYAQRVAPNQNGLLAATFAADGSSNPGGTAALTTADTIAVTCSTTGGRKSAIAAAVPVGVARCSSAEQAVGSSGPSGTALSVTSGTLAWQDETAVAAAAVNPAAGGYPVFAAGWTPVAQENTPGGTYLVVAAKTTGAGTAAVTAAATSPASAQWAMMLTTLYPAWTGS